MYRPGMFPVLYEQTYYDAQSKPLRKSRYEYIMVNDHIFEGIKASQIGNFPDVYLKKKQPDHDRYSAYDAFNRVISCCYPTIHTGTQVLSSQQDISYFGTDSVVVSRTFEYDDRNRLVRETQTGSDNTLIAQEMQRWPTGWSFRTCCSIGSGRGPSRARVRHQAWHTITPVIRFGQYRSAGLSERALRQLFSLWTVTTNGVICCNPPIRMAFPRPIYGDTGEPVWSQKSGMPPTNRSQTYSDRPG